MSGYLYTRYPHHLNTSALDFPVCRFTYLYIAYFSNWRVVVAEINLKVVRFIACITLRCVILFLTWCDALQDVYYSDDNILHCCKYLRTPSSNQSQYGIN